MEIKSQFENGGKIYHITYQDGVPETAIPEITRAVHSFCFYGDKLVIVSKDGQHWTPPGGEIESGENFEEASVREVKEETNMRVIYQECIGYQDSQRVEDGNMLRQFRMFCIVEPYGDFTSDPDEDIFHVKLIDPSSYKNYIKWEEIGDRLMERALEMKREWDSKQILGN